MPTGKRDVEFVIRAKNLSPREIKKLREDIKSAGAEVRNFNRHGAKMADVGKKMTSSARSTGIAAGASAAAIGLAVNQSAKYEEGIARIAALTNTKLSAALNKYSGGIDKISKQTGIGVDKLNAALFDAISAGVEESKALKFIEHNARAAVGGFSDLKGTVKGTVAIMNSYNYSAEKAGLITDQINIAADKGITTFGAMGENVGRVAAQAATLKISSGDLLAALATITKTGLSTEQSLTRVTGVLNAIQNPSREAVEALKELQKNIPVADRLSLSVKSIQQEGLLNYFNKLQKLTGGNATEINNLFGSNIRAAQGMAILSQNTESFNNIAAEMAKATEEGRLTLNKFDIASESNAFKIRLMKQEIASLIRSIGRSLMPVVQDIISDFREWTSTALEFIRNNQELVRSIAGVAAKLTAIGIVLSPSLFFVGQMTIAIGGLINIMGKLKVAAAGFNIVNFLNPMTMAAVAVMGLVMAVKTFNEQLKKANEEAVKARLVKKQKKKEIPGAGIEIKEGQSLTDALREGRLKSKGEQQKTFEELAKGYKGRKYEIPGTVTTAAASTGGIHQRLLIEQEKASKSTKDTLDKNNNDIVKSFKNTQKKINAINKQAQKEREKAAAEHADKMKNNFKKEIFDPLNIPIEKFVTEDVLKTLSNAGGKGFLTDKVKSNENVDNSKSINISKIDMENVDDPESWIENLFRYSDQLDFSFAG